MLALVVEVMSVAMICAGVGGALLVSGAWLSHRKFLAGGSSRHRHIGHDDREDER